MERRNFLRSLVGGVAVAAAARSWPFRVYSFPSEPKIYPGRLFQYTDRYFGLYGTDGHLIAYLNRDQLAAMRELGIALHRPSLDLSGLTWENLKRSPKPWTSLNNSDATKA
jgi:hypothetical protein